MLNYVLERGCGVNNDATNIVTSAETLHYGRKKIILDYDKVDSANVVEVLQEALKIHTCNEQDCSYLINYFLGKQDILNRSEPLTSNINNKVVSNYAFPITREIVGYTYGNPIEFIQNDIGKQDDVETLSDIFADAGSYNADIITAYYQSICGVGYQITLPSSEISEDYIPDVPIVIEALDPRDTFVVCNLKVGNPQIMSCHRTYSNEKGYTYNVYTREKIFEINDKFEVKSITNNALEKDPIVIFENSIFMTGDWEQAISVMNASNTIASDSLNDIEGTIRSLLVLLGAEFEDDETGLSQIKKNRLLTLANPQGGSVDAKFISPQIESASIENIREYLEDARNVITGIPDRQTASGGDTGTAVLNRNGWTDIEIVAKLKELFFKKSKKKQLGIGIKVLQKLGIVSQDLTPLNINMTIGRHTTDNLQTKTQAFSTLVATGELATIDCLEMSGLTNRTNEVVQRGEEAKKKRQEETIKFDLKEQKIAQKTKAIETDGEEPQKQTDNTDK